MKHLLLLFLFSGSLAAFSQVADTTQPLRQFDASKWGSPVTSASIGAMTLQSGSVEWRLPVTNPDTVRAICLVTLSPKRHSTRKNGLCGNKQGKRPVYLDCQKRALKLPQVGWGYELVNPNKNK